MTGSGVTAAFMYRVHGNQSSLAESLDRQESAARQLIRAASLDVGLADHHWRGPRSRKVIGSAEDYLATVREYPNAVSAGATTIRRWARAALASADALASDDWCGTEDVPNADRRPSGAREEIVAAWRRTCVAHAFKKSRKTVRSRWLRTAAFDGSAKSPINQT